jgi:hypothetical protein
MANAVMETPRILIIKQQPMAKKRTSKFQKQSRSEEAFDILQLAKKRTKFQKQSGSEEALDMLQLGGSQHVNDFESNSASTLRKYDVVFHQSGLFSNVEGNINFYRTVGVHKAFFMNASDEERKRVALIIVNTMKLRDPPGRFLQEHHNVHSSDNDDDFIILSDIEAVSRTYSFLEASLTSRLAIDPGEASFLNVDHWELDMRFLEGDDFEIKND